MTPTIRTVDTAEVIVVRQSEPTQQQTYRLIEDSGVLKFWDDEEYPK